MKRSKFSLSNYKLLSMNMGNLVPIGWHEVLPGDTMQHSTSALIRCSPLLAPVMHPVHVRIHHWFVPYRILWEDFEDFITGGLDGMDDSVFPTMQIPVTPTDFFFQGGLADYLGIDPDTATAATKPSISALPFRAYNLIFNEWYRDQDLMAELPISFASGPDSTTKGPLNTYNLANAAWDKDYFTTARPWPQKGPDITIPMADTAPVVTAGNNNIQVQTTSSSTNRALRADNASGSLVLNPSYTGTPSGDLRWVNPNLQADLSNASAHINELRTAFALQRYEEARARYGSRYTEYLRYLGVKSSDARLQRPEYLGGGKQTIQFSEVLQTAPGETDEDPVGAMKGHGIAAMRSNRYRRFFEEHGLVMSFMHVRPRNIYSQGLHRSWSRRTKEDFFQKELQHIGQQEVYYKEVYSPGDNPNNVFGYQDRYDEYRHQPSTIAGEFRDTLDYWHMARIFSSTPALNSAFVESNPSPRVFADQTSQQLYVMANHSIQARRLVSANTNSFVF